MLQQVYVIFLKCGTGRSGIPNFCFRTVAGRGKLAGYQRIPYRDKDDLLLPYYLFE